MATDPEIFSDVPLFALLDPDERLILSQQVEVRNFGAAETIYKMGDASQRAYVVQHGVVRVTMVDGDGNEVQVDVASQGDIFGLSSMLAAAPHLTTAVAVEATCAIEIDRNDLTVLFQKKPGAAMDLLTMSGRQMRATQELIRGRVTQNLNVMMEEKETLGDRVADMVARFGGSWRFIGTFGAILVIWISANVILGNNAWDVYPFILLNLFLSMLAAIQAPVIMMSQNRQDTKDRLRSEMDYNVNLKAELEVSQLLEKVGNLEQKLDLLMEKGLT